MYEAPRIREVGTVAGLTLEHQLALDFDGDCFHRSANDGGGVS